MEENMDEILNVLESCTLDDIFRLCLMPPERAREAMVNLGLDEDKVKAEIIALLKQLRRED